MKLLNTNTFAVIAIMAIGLTAFTKGYTEVKNIGIPNCYQAFNPQLTSAFTPSTLHITTSSSCIATLSQLTNKVGIVSNFYLTK